MNPKPFSLSILSLLAAGCAVFLLPGCASMEQANTKSLLSAAGFHTLTPSTATQKEIYAALPPDQVNRATVKGKVFYLYKDANAGVAYVGHEPEYQRYRELAIQQKIAQQYYMAAEMERMNAYRWSGAWGPHRIYW